MISIIVPFNNGKKYLERCLKNLKEIKYSDFEVILVDDFSEDKSEEIAKKYKKDLNIKYYYTNEKTIGVGNARNLGIEKASGDYIIFVDVDDTIDNNLLVYLQKYIDEEIEVIKYKMRIIENNNHKEILANGVIFGKTSGQEGFNKLCFNDRFLDSPCVYLIKKDIFKRTNLKFEKNVFHEDFGLIPQLIINAKSMVSTNYYGYNYIQSTNSIMRNDNYEKEVKKVNDKFIHYENLIKNIAKYNLKKRTKYNLLNYYTNSIIVAIKSLDKKDRIYFEKKLKSMRIIKKY